MGHPRVATREVERIQSAQIEEDDRVEKQEEAQTFAALKEGDKASEHEAWQETISDDARKMRQQEQMEPAIKRMRAACGYTGAK
jgi:hypothetical protein